MKPLRIVFFGTPDFASASLRSLLDADEQVVAVVTQPDRKQGRNQKLLPPPVKVLAESRGIPVIQPASVRTSDFLTWFQEQNADLAVVVAYGKIIPPQLLALPPHGFVNVHASLLPKYRGASPIQSALIHGETESGVTIMKMDEGLDTGPMYLTRRVALDESTTAAELHDELAVVGGEALVEMLCELRTGTVTLTDQEDEHATYAPLLKKQMEKWIGPSMRNRSSMGCAGAIHGLEAFAFMREGGFVCFPWKDGNPGRRMECRVKCWKSLRIASAFKRVPERYPWACASWRERKPCHRVNL